MATRAACPCGIADWRDLRRALGVPQTRMARLLHLSARQVQRLEAESGAGHRCPSRNTIWFLRRALRCRELQERLEAADFPYPYAADWSRGRGGGEGATGPRAVDASGAPPPSTPSRSQTRGVR